MLNIFGRGNKKEEAVVNSPTDEKKVSNRPSDKESFSNRSFDYDEQRARFESIAKSLSVEDNSLDPQIKMVQREIKLTDFRSNIVSYTKHIASGISGETKDPIIEKEVYLLLRMMQLYTVYCPNYSKDPIFTANAGLYNQMMAIRRNNLGVTKEEYHNAFLRKERELYEMTKPEENGTDDSYQR